MMSGSSKIPGERTAARARARWRNVGGAAVGVVVAFSADAAPLEKAECDALKLEQERLVATGTRANMTRGPEWARSHLAADKLGHIERLILVDEQIAFRCPHPKPPLEPAEKGDQATTAKKTVRDPAKAGSAEAAPGKAADLPAASATAVPKTAKAKPAPAKAADAAPQTPVAGPAPKKEARKPKPAADAFSPAAAAVKAGTGEAAAPAR